MRQHGDVAESFSDADACANLFLKAQETLKDGGNCAQRRQDRIPPSIRSVLSEAAVCSCESERRRLRAVAAELFREHRHKIQEERSKYIVKSGRVFQKSKKLHQIEGLCNDEGMVLQARDEWHDPLRCVYQEKWGSERFQLRSEISDFLAKNAASDFRIEWNTITEALDTISKSSSRDPSGISVLIIRAFVYGCPETAVTFFTKLLTQTSFMQSFVVQGTVYGKTSKYTAPNDTRAILPLPAVLVVADALVAIIMHNFIDLHCPVPQGIFFGARRGTQVLDIAHAAQLHLQKGGDNFGIAGLAQGDIATYYDCLDCLRIAHWLHHLGLAPFWVCAFVRLQVLPNIHLTAGGTVTFEIASRTIGTLTGSRTAVAAGRIPVESTACALAPDWQSYGVKTADSITLFAAWVDNYYTFGKELTSAISIAESFELDLQRKWGLTIKDSSRSVMSPQRPDSDWHESKWPRMERTKVLGHLVSSDASPWPCWRATEKSMWAAFWANCVGSCTRGLDFADRCKLLNRCVRPVLFFRNTRWPFTRTLADSQNRVQRQMLGYFFKVERMPCEDDAHYNRRRMRQISYLARQYGTWGHAHAQRVVDWAEHLKRPHNSASPAAQLYAWRGPHWLHARRLDPDVGSGMHRPGTRSSPGPVVRRWDESVPDAREYVQSMPHQNA